MAAFDCEDVLNVLKRFVPLACFVAPLAAQVAPHAADLHGVVADSSGKPVKGAEVKVYQGEEVLSEETTNLRGDFVFKGPTREYRVMVSAPGFEPLQSSAIPFTPRGVTRFTLLRPGEVQIALSPVQEAATQRGWEVGVLAQGGVGLGERSDYRFLLLGGHAGKLLTSNFGAGLLRGNFEYAVEVFPFWQSYTPVKSKVACTADPPAPVGTYTCSQPYDVGGTYTGVSVTPIILRWNFTSGKRWAPWVQGAGGLVWTNHKYPAIGNTNTVDTATNGPHGDSSVWNFTPQFGIGTHYFVKSRQSVDFSANAVHLSSASLGDKNPGVNASVQFSIGYTWWR